MFNISVAHLISVLDSRPENVLGATGCGFG